MALDSKTKRYAVPGAGRPFMRSQFPVGAKNRAWRSSVANTYPVKDFEGAPSNTLTTYYYQHLMAS